MLADCVAGEWGGSYIKVSATEIVAGMSGESEQRVRALFQAAREASPCVVFLDEVDAIMGKRSDGGRGMERRIVAQLLTSMDELGGAGGHVVVVGATNRPDSIDPALRR